MIQENKDLLLKDLCARLPYGVKGFVDGLGIVTLRGFADYVANDVAIEHNGNLSWMEVSNFKPYLRPMSSMTEEECITLSKLIPYETDAWKHIKTPIPLYIANIEQFDFFHRHHLDWRGLISKGLALEASKNIYNNE